MFKAVLMFCLLISSAAFATTKEFDLKIELALDGQNVASPQMTVRENETSTIIQETGHQKVSIAVTATDSGDRSGIQMTFLIGTVSADGKQTTLSQPRIIALENEMAHIKVGQADGKETLSLKVIAKRKAL